MQAALAGFGLGLSLILAIGAQNAFVLRQGLVQRHVFAVCLTCAVSDALLIIAGVAGFGALTRAVPWLEMAMRLGGAAFLLWYGALSLLRSWRGGDTLKAGAEQQSLTAALLTCLALTWLNPHVYLDTLVLLGAVSAKYDAKLGFALGAVTASFVFFFTLGYGARLLAPVLARPGAWRTVDALIGVLMWTIAATLLQS
ncbi:LysE/ArgO family amino acid transporter [Puniceibacterium confluentis]|uniref:LysE/ArgO family amino acid transporter n=2 Tax=Puniceibacterium confluentis TaxID=1958944 RepID=UPI0011B35EB9|nr:LysE/ArgO family amino acid transporter [Puniceibacterium confluentis]